LGIYDAMKKIYKEHNSLKGFYRGYLVTIAGMIPYGGLSFSTFETLKIFFLTERIPALSIKTNIITDEHHKYELTVVGKLICGGLTGAIAQTVTYPLDVVRRHMQLEGMIDDKNFKKYLT
jgi:solute carrier family 25 (mitochondrial carrier protein), member 16